MKPSEEFKVGDLVKIKNFKNFRNKKDNRYLKEIDTISNLIILKDEIYYMLKNGNTYWFSFNNLELIKSTEEQSIEKYKKELKDKINKKIKENIDNNIINFETLTKKEILELLK